MDDKLSFFRSYNNHIICEAPPQEEEPTTILGLLNPKSKFLELTVVVQPADDASLVPGTLVYVHPNQKDAPWYKESYDLGDKKVISVPKDKLILALSQYFTNYVVK